MEKILIVILCCVQHIDYADITEYLLDKGADTYITLPQNPYTPLAISAIRGNVATTKLLIEKENSVDYKDNYGNTALIYALDSQEFNKELCEFYCQRGLILKSKMIMVILLP